MSLQANALTTYINQMWDEEIIPALQEYIKIPNRSPQFDPKWRENGYMQQAVTLIANWCQHHAIPGMSMEVIQLEQRTPLILIEIPGKADETILLYGHLDKQPEMQGWAAGLHPYKPVLRDDKLYGRGGADDGYAAFSALTAIKALHQQGLAHARCVILIEASEESGSIDLPFYMQALKEQIGTPNLVICLDSGCGNYEQFWLTSSLRGLLGGTLSIRVLNEGIHSGYGSGIAPGAMRILRHLLTRLEDVNSGDIIIPELQVTIPEIRKQQAKAAADVLGKAVYSDLPFAKNVKPESLDSYELILRRTWQATLAVIGADGLPLLEDAGNVLLPYLAVKLSLRLPPTCNPETAALAVKKVLEANPPYNAEVNFTLNDTGPGWNAPVAADWLMAATEQASEVFFGKPCMTMGEGGSIPFMGMLGRQFPKAQFVITGVLGPKSNAHGPNEFLHIPTGKKITACVAKIIYDHYQQC